MSARAKDSQHARRRAHKPATDDEARRALEASEKLYYRIGEVSKLTGVKAHVLRYWETEFRWMAPPKSRSKQRLYRKRDIEFVWLLKKLLWEERYTIAGARQRIQDLGIEEALALLGREPTAAGAHGPPTAATATATAEDGRAANPAIPDTPTATTSAPAPRNSESEWAPAWGELERELGELSGELSSLRALLQDSA